MHDVAGITVFESMTCWVTVSSITAMAGRSFDAMPAWYFLNSSSLEVPWLSMSTFTFDCDAL